MFCGKCGNQIPDDAKFCGHCGAAVTSNAGTAAEPPVRKAVKADKKKVPVWAFGVAAAAVVGIIVIVAITAGSNSESGYHRQHEWTEATCTEPRTCTVGGETEGEPLGHTWKQATCTEPKTCSTCGQAEGSALGHTWVEATCTEPKTCSTCGQTEGTTAEHVWREATCTEPRTCNVCGITEGGLVDHRLDNYGICLVCHERIGTVITDFYDYFTFTNTSPYESPFTITVTPLRSGYRYNGTVSFAVTRKDIVDVYGDMMTLSGYQEIELDESGNGSLSINFNTNQHMIIYEFNGFVGYYY